MKTEGPSIVIAMDQWTINRRSLILLLGVLGVIALVLVLPQVDLLDTAFHLGTAPIVLHSQVTEKPVFQILSGLFVFFLFATGIAHRLPEDRLLIVGSHEAQILNHCFRC